MTDDLIGRTLRDGEYELKQVISRGGQATVYRAYARRLETDVAVKILKQSLAVDLAFRERFHDEARTLAKLHHPNLVEVHWYGEEGELVYIVMRLVPGGTLKDRLQALGGSLGLTDTARTIGQVAAALQDAHDHGVLHLDVKPANVLLGRADWPLVADLGLTQAIQREPSSAGHSRVAGTPAYMSPEQCRGGDLDARSDQYSLAVTAYELLTGRQPFHAETTDALMQQHLELAPPRPREINAGLPGPVEEVLLRGLAKEPGDRFPTIADFGQALTEAVDRTRGVSLEAKRAAAATAPNLLAILALVLAAPFMLAILPVGNVLGRLPLAWPFQLLLAGAVAALLLGVRWHLIGLVGRAAAGSLATLDRVSRRQVMLGTHPGGPLRVEDWRHSARASAEGLVNLLYLLVTYRLVGAPALAAIRVLVEPAVYRLVDTAALLVVGVAAVGIVAGIARSGGPIPAALVLAIGWAATIALPTFEVDLSEARTLALTAQLVVAAGLLLLLGAHRPRVAKQIGPLASGSLGRLLIEGRPHITPEEAEAGKRQIERLAVNVLDFGYLLLGYVLLRAPVVDLLIQFTTPVAAAILATGVACLAWLVLVARLQWTAGLLGAVLGIVLGAPLLLSLPLLDSGLLQATLPATIASWVAAGSVLLLIAALRGPTQALGRTAFGARLDRGLLGANAASSEEQSARRASALGSVAGALIDVGFLLIGYWVVGVPASLALIRMTGEPAFSSVVLAGVLLLSLMLMLAPARNAGTTLADTGGAQWRGRARAFTVLALAAAAVLVAIGGAAPVAVAGPSPIGAQGLLPAMTRMPPPTVVVDRDFFEPFKPRLEQSTYNLALHCSNGGLIGQFHEAYEPPAGQSLPAGSVGQLGATDVACDDWQQLYLARREAAGLPAIPSFGWEWLDVQASVNADGTIDVVQTQRVQFSAGRHASLSWNLGDSAASVQNLEVWEGDTNYPLVSDRSPGERYAQTWDSAGERWVSWSFPALTGPEQRTYTLKYRLATDGAAPDATVLFNHRVATTDRRVPVWRTTVEVHLPDELGQTDLGLSVSGAPVQTGRIGDRTLWFENSDLAGGQALSVAVTRLPGASPQNTTPDIQPLLPTSGASPTLGTADSPATSTAPMVPPPTSPTPTPKSTATPVPATGAVDATPDVDTPTATSVVDAASSSTATAEPQPASDLTASPESDASSQPAPGQDTSVPTATVSLSPSPSVAPTLSPTSTMTSVATSAPSLIGNQNPTASATPSSTPTSSPTPKPTPRRTTSQGQSDSSPPIITHTISPAPNAQGWNNTPLTISWSAGDPESGVSSSTGCTPITLSAETSGLTQVCSARNGAGEDATDTVQVKIDMTAPVITHTLSRAPNAFGWNNGPVTVSWTISKTLSGIGAANGCEPTTVSADTPGTTLTCSVSSVAGSTSSDSVVLRIDTTAPLLHATVKPTLAAAGQNVQVSLVASEALGGPPVVSLSGSCVPTEGVSMTQEGNTLPATYTGTYTVPAGSNDCVATIGASGTDLAGNASTGTGAALDIDRSPPALAVNASLRLARAGTTVSIDVLPSVSLAASPLASITANCLSGSPIGLPMTPATQGDGYVATFNVPAGTTDCLASIVVVGSDLAGNQGTGSTQLAIDRTPPELTTSVNPSLARAADTIRITVAASEDLGNPPSVSITGACVPDDGVSMALSGGVYQGTYVVPEGSTNCAALVQATGEDVAGNPSAPETGRAELDVKRSQPLLTTSASLGLARAGTLVNISMDAGADQLAQAPTVDVSGGCISTSSVSVIPAGASTSYTATYTVPEGSSDCVATVSATGFDVAHNPTSGGQTTFSIDRTPPVLGVAASPNPVQPGDRVTVSVEASEELGSAPTVTLAAAADCLPREIHVSMSPTGQARSFKGTFGLPEIDGNCTGTITASGEDLAHNQSSAASTSLTIGPATQLLSVSVQSPISGTGNLVSDPAGIKCVAGSTDGCAMSVARHTPVKLFAQDANEKVGFDTWKGSDSCSGADPTCTVVMDTNHNEVATFRVVVASTASPTPVPATPSPSPTPTPPPIFVSPGAAATTVAPTVEATAGPSLTPLPASGQSPAPNATGGQSLGPNATGGQTTAPNATGGPTTAPNATGGQSLGPNATGGQSLGPNATGGPTPTPVAASGQSQAPNATGGPTTAPNATGGPTPAPTSPVPPGTSVPIQGPQLLARP